MRRQRIFGLCIVCFLLLSLTFICANAAWFIQDRDWGEAEFKDAAQGNSNATTTSEYFTLTYTYNGAKITPELTDTGKAVFGYSSAAEGFDFEWLGGTDAAGSIMYNNTPEEYQRMIAGTHRYRVVEKTTGQVIYDNLQATINQATLTVGTLTPSTAPTFVSQAASYTFTINGVEGKSIEYTDAATVPYDAFTAGANITTQYSGLPAVFDPAKLTLPTLNSSNLYINSNNYKKPEATTATFSCTVLPTCYSIASGESAIFYGSLNQALKVTNENYNTAVGAGTTPADLKLVAMQSFTYNGTTYTATGHSTGNYTHTIGGSADGVYGGDKIIAPNVSLVIPYEATGSSFTGVEDANHITGTGYDRMAVNGGVYASTENTEAPASRYTPSPVCKNLVTLSGTLTNNGQLQLCGRTGYTYPTSSYSSGYVSGNANSVAQGCTTGNHSTLQMTAGASLQMTESTSELHVFGYVADAADSSVEVHSGTVRMPFAIYDYNGGTYTVGMYNGGNLSPFATFDMPNIQAELICYGGEGGANIHAYTSVYTGAFDKFGIKINPKYNLADFPIFANADALFNTTDGYVSFKYDTTSGAYTTSGYLPKRANATHIHLMGSTSSGDIAMTIDTGIHITGIIDGSADVALSTVTFPISDKIKLHFGGGKSYEFTSVYKLLPGAEFYVEDGSTVTINSGAGLLVYGAWDTSATRYTGNTALNYYYDRSHAVIPAICQVTSGTLMVNGSLGGTVLAASASARIDTRTATALTMSEPEGNGESSGISFVLDSTGTESQTANGFILTGLGTAANANFTTANYKTYDEAIDSQYAWSQKATITFNPNGGAVSPATKEVNIGSDGMMEDVSVLTGVLPTKDGVEFAGWFVDAALTTELTSSSQITANTTLYAKWDEPMATVTLDANGKSETFAQMLSPYGSFTPPAPSEYDETINYNPEKNYYLLGWSTTEGATTVTQTTFDVASETLTLYAVWGTKEHTITLETTNATITIDYNEMSYSSSDHTYLYVRDKEQIAGGVQYDAEATENRSFTFGGTTWDGSAKTITADVTISATANEACIAAGTLITLADGTQKKVEDLLETDILLVFDHEKGIYVEAPILFIERDGWREYTLINLTFSNGTTTRLIYEHALFDLTLNRYVYITESNYGEFVGHEFALLAEDGYDTVTLTEAFLTTEYTGCYSLVTAYHLNYFIDGLFSIPGGIDGLFNFFEYDENLCYDKEQMQADIDEYGLYTYEDFAPYLPEEVYYAFQAPYFKVAVGKGMITFEEILALIDRYLVGNGII